MMGKVTVVGLGPGDPGAITRAAETALRGASRLVLRTEIHPTVAELRRWGLAFSTCDDCYVQGEAFEQVYARIVERLVDLADQGDLVYAVPGHPLVAETTVTMLRDRLGDRVVLVAGLSALEALYACTGLDPNAGLQVVDGLAMEGRKLQPDWWTVVLQVHAQSVASEVKLALMDTWPDEHAVQVVQSAGIPGQERVRTVPLHELDHLEDLDHLTSIVIPPAPRRGIQRAVDVVARLRAPDGCPWDREQTPRTLTRHVLEEAHEVVEAIERDDVDGIEEELGDLFLQVALQAQIFDEEGEFDLEDVCDRLADKLIRRHPHVFGTTEVAGSEEVLVNWEVIKRQEKAEKGESGDRDGIPSTSALAGVVMSQSALVVSEKLQGKAAKVRFDWKDPVRVLAKLQEEVGELGEALADDLGTEALTHELGDVLTATVNLARQLKLDPEAALREANRRFIRRFTEVERLAGGSLDHLELRQMESLWQDAKRNVG